MAEVLKAERKACKNPGIGLFRLNIPLGLHNTKNGNKVFTGKYALVFSCEGFATKMYFCGPIPSVHQR